MILVVFLQLSNYPVGYTFAILSQGIRSVAMGQSFTAVSDDATGIYYNTAGLSFLRGFDSKIAMYDLYDQLAILTMNIAFPIDIFGFGFGISLWGDEQDRYDELGNRIGSFSNMEVLSMGAFSVKPLRHFSFGGGVKYLYSNFADYESSGVLWDLGMMYLPSDFLRFGISLRNIGFPRKFINIYEYPSSELRMGGAFLFPILDVGHFIYSLDLSLHPYRIDLGTGFEIALYIPEFVKEFVEADISGLRIWGGFNTSGYSFEDHLFYGLGVIYGIGNNFYLNIEGVYTSHFHLGNSIRMGISLYYYNPKNPIRR